MEAGALAARISPSPHDVGDRCRVGWFVESRTHGLEERKRTGKPYRLRRAHGLPTRHVKKRAISEPIMMALRLMRSLITPAVGA
jgi:hypothetical protein